MNLVRLVFIYSNTAAPLLAEFLAEFFVFF